MPLRHVTPSPILAFLSLLPLIAWAAPANVADIGSRRELFVEDTLIERLSGKAELRLHAPVPREIVIVHDEPWEGPGSGYHSLFKDGDLFRMYYKAWKHVVAPGPVYTEANPLNCCYAESDDGIHWRKPKLGLHEFQGSKANNIVMTSGVVGKLRADAGHPAVFKDENPNAQPDARYKAFLRSHDPKGLLAYKSADGIHWSPLSDTPVITDGAFDSQNLAFWDAGRGEYRAYWRFFAQGVVQDDRNPVGLRSIRTATSRDFIHWDNFADLKYVDSPPEQLYTNQIKPYYRAPHVYIGFPMRYTDRGWTDSVRALPNAKHREWRAAMNVRMGTALSDTVFMASRDGVTFKRWNDAFLRPGIERDGTWSYGQQCVAWQVVETNSALEGAPNELSVYATESYFSGAKGSSVRRYTLRLDGFVSVKAPMSGGELLTKPVRFQGRQLLLNFSTSAAGSVRVEVQDLNGRPLPGFALDDCPLVFGDALARPITWKKGGDISSLANQSVRLRFVLQDADLYAYQFNE